MSAARLQDLSPRWAHFCLTVEGFVCQYLGLELQGKNLLLAFSGGGDSMALALWTLACRQRWQAKVCLAHLDHGLRPESRAETGFVRRLAAHWDVPLYCASTRIRTFALRKGVGLEEGARIMRYRFLRAVARKIGADYILTAHHLNDLAEDLFLRLLRGAGWPALAGMQAWQSQDRLLRPFLLQPKDLLLGFVQDQGLSWLEDSSNQDLAYKRNRVRHRILPLFVAENTNFLQAVAGLWKQARVDGKYWDRQLAGVLADERVKEDGILLPASVLAQVPQALRLRWYRSVLDRLGPGQVRSANLFILDELWTDGRPGKLVQFPGGKTACIERTGILLRPSVQQDKAGADQDQAQPGRPV